MTEDGRPCPEARFFQRHDGVTRALGKADAEGRLALEQVPPDYCELLAHAPGLAAESRRVVPPLAEELVIALREGQTLVGEVRRVDGGRLPAGTSVVAIPSVQAQGSAVRSPASLLVDPDVLLVECGVDGRFVFRDVHPLVTYGLLAVAQGWLMPEDPASARAGDEVGPLVLHPAYGLRMEFVGGDRRAADLTLASGARGGLRMLSLPADVLVFTGHPLARWMAGVPLELLEPTSTEMVVLGTTTDERPDAGPLEVSLHPQGYAPFTQSLRLPRLTGGLTRRELRLEAIGNALTQVEFALEFPDLVPAALLDPYATLSFGPRSGLDTVYALTQSDMRSKRLGPIEPGLYRVRFQVRPYLFERMQDVQIEPSGTRLAWDAADAARLQVDVFTADGDPYFGELALLVATPLEERVSDDMSNVPMGMVRFARGPYLLQPLDARPRYVCVPDGEYSELRWQRIELARGARGRISLQLK